MKIIEKKRHIIRKAVYLCLIIFFIWVTLDNALIHTTYTTVQLKGLPDSFSGYRIVQVSDLHNNLYGPGQSYLISCIKAAKPDIIVVTGDLIDRNTHDVDNAMAFIGKAVEIAPVFYVTGNHESGVLSKYMELALRMNEAGVTQLNNGTASLSSKGEKITLAGIIDPDFDWSMSCADKADAEIKAALADSDREQVTILLSHRPELLKTYADNGLDLVLTGHAHGGQVRLPFIGPIYSPSQGLFPKLTSGLYREGETQMFVSRGIGNGIAPYRFNDGPELAVIILEKAD